MLPHSRDHPVGSFFGQEWELKLTLAQVVLHEDDALQELHPLDRLLIPSEDVLRMAVIVIASFEDIVPFLALSFPL